MRCYLVSIGIITLPEHSQIYPLSVDKVGRGNSGHGLVRGNSGHFNVATGKKHRSFLFLLLVSCRQVESLDIHGQKFA